MAKINASNNVLYNGIRGFCHVNSVLMSLMRFAGVFGNFFLFFSTFILFIAFSLFIFLFYCFFFGLCIPTFFSVLFFFFSFSSGSQNIQCSEPNRRTPYSDNRSVKLL